MKTNAMIIRWASGFEYERSRYTIDIFFGVVVSEEIASVELPDKRGCRSASSVFILEFTTTLSMFLVLLSITNPEWKVTDATNIQANWHQKNADCMLTSVYASIFTTANIIIKTATTVDAGHVYSSRSWPSVWLDNRPMMAPPSTAERMMAQNQNSIMDVAKLYDDRPVSVCPKKPKVNVATEMSQNANMKTTNSRHRGAILTAHPSLHTSYTHTRCYFYWPYTYKSAQGHVVLDPWRPTSRLI